VTQILIYLMTYILNDLEIRWGRRGYSFSCFPRTRPPNSRRGQFVKKNFLENF
jgi:hypothetical protein